MSLLSLDGSTCPYHSYQFLMFFVHFFLSSPKLSSMLSHSCYTIGSLSYVRKFCCNVFINKECKQPAVASELVPDVSKLANTELR